MDMVTVTDMAMEAMDMDTMATMARGLLRLPLMPSPVMAIMVMAMDMVTDTDMAMEAMDMDTMATMARGLLMPLPVMDTMVMDMDMDMDTVTDMAMTTTDKFLLFNAVESSVQTKNLDH